MSINVLISPVFMLLFSKFSFILRVISDVKFNLYFLLVSHFSSIYVLMLSWGWTDLLSQARLKLQRLSMSFFQKFLKLLIFLLMLVSFGMVI